MTLHNELLELRKKENEVTALILEKLHKMENSKGYLPMGYSSLFDYLVRGLNYSESTAYQRQCCVRLSRELPEIKEKLNNGSLTYSNITTVFKSIRNKNREEKQKIIATIENKSAREVKKMFLQEAPLLKIKESHFSNKVVMRLELTHDEHAKFEKLKHLKSHRHNMESLLLQLIENELKNYEIKKRDSQKDLCSTEQRDRNPSPLLHNHTNPRYIPRRLRNTVLKKSSYQCEYPGCESTRFLQIDHIIPVRAGGLAEKKNLQVLCSAHNRWKG